LTEKLTITYEKPAAWVESKKASPGSLGTEHLPVAVTKQPIAVSVWSTTEEINEESGRPRGWYAYALSIAGRENPANPTDDEREYVAAILEFTARLFRDRNPFAPEDVRLDI